MYLAQVLSRLRLLPHLRRQCQSVQCLELQRRFSFNVSACSVERNLPVLSATGSGSSPPVWASSRAFATAAGSYAAVSIQISRELYCLRSRLGGNISSQNGSHASSLTTGSSTHSGTSRAWRYSNYGPQLSEGSTTEQANTNSATGDAGHFDIGIKTLLLIRFFIRTDLVTY